MAVQQKTLFRVAGYFLNRGKTRFPFENPVTIPNGDGLFLDRGWVYLVSLDTVKRMKALDPVHFLCDFPATLMVEGEGFNRLKDFMQLQIGGVKVDVRTVKDVCLSFWGKNCELADQCPLRVESILVSVADKGTVSPGDPITPLA